MQSKSKKILKLECSDPDSSVEIKTMKHGRAFSFPVLTNQGKNFFIIGGCKEQKVEIYDCSNGLKELDQK
jgi:hypothetical protein